MSLSPRLIVAIVTVFAGVVFITTLVRATLYAPGNEVASSTLAAQAPAREALPSDLPEHLRVPALGIDAFVRQVGVNEAGNMATPGNFTDVGWYKYGTVPGFAGSAVIDGHVDNGLALDGVFKHLSELKPGDDIYIDTAGEGTTTPSVALHFIVERTESYPVADVPLVAIFKADDAVRLNLITCDGVFSRGVDEYDRRLVVYAVLK